MLLGFKRRFAGYVEEGSKRHSIRGGDRWKVGMRADCYVDPRQKTMRLLGRFIVNRVEPIRIQLARGPAYATLPPTVWVGEEQLTGDEMSLLFWNDGFRELMGAETSTSQAVEFWVTEHKLKAGALFTGQIIYWPFVHVQKNGEPIQRRRDDL